jgi:hypothetical protein
MNKQRYAAYGLAKLILALLALQPLAVSAQVPVDDDGKVIGAYEPVLAADAETLNANASDVPLMSAVDLEELVGPVALYPDDLLAIILPAAAYPQQIIDATRFLEDLESNPELKPNPEWDDSVVALLNYPEVIELMNDDIDWTWRLGEAVIAQQQDVLSAIETFRDRAYNAGNLKSDEYQTVARNDGHIEISPVADDVIYVPYYEPERVVVYQPRPVYHYYPRSYPVYYYPYSSAYYFDSGYFWGVTTAFSIGWYSSGLNVYHHSYYGHPYYGHHYWNHWWYRRPTMTHYQNNYIGNTRVTVNNYYNGDRWRPRHDRRDYVRTDARAANNRYAANRQAQRQVSENRRSAEQRARAQTVNRQEPVAFRDRPVDFQARTRGQRRSAQEQRTNEQRSEQRSNTRQSRSDGTARQNREYVANLRDQRPQTPQRREVVAQQRNETARTSGQQRRAPVPQAGEQRRERATPQAQRREQRATPTPQRQQRAVPAPQRQQRAVPAPQRQQRAAPAPQRQQRSAPAPQPQQRSAPAPQAQQRSAPAPQRQERSSSGSSQKRSEGRRRDRR